jgi:hypothetical protein
MHCSLMLLGLPAVTAFSPAAGFAPASAFLKGPALSTRPAALSLAAPKSGLTPLQLAPLRREERKV